MSYTRIIRFVCISILCCGITMSLLYVTMGRTNSTKNGFNRRLPVVKLAATQSVALPYEDFYIAGLTSDRVYMGTIKNALRLFVCDSGLQHIRQVMLDFPDSVRFTIQSARFAVDSPHVYLSDGITPKFFRGDLQHLVMDTFLGRSSYFTAATNISPESFAVRSVNANSGSNMLMKVQGDSPFVVRPPDVLKKQVDGVFCTDGQFKYDKASNRIVYMYYYRNQYIVLDTNLHVLQQVNTIDTNSVAKIKVASTSASGGTTLSVPPAFVNNTYCLAGGMIFIRSALLGDNESPKVLAKGNIVDVYSLKDGHYIRTLYVPKQHDESLREMCVVNHQLFAVYPKECVVYNLPQDLLLQ
jgi:hypothetical protein